MSDKSAPSKVINIKNKEIGYKYNIIEKLECGIALKGTEVKSIRDGACTLKESFALIRNGEVILKSMHISPYEMGNINNVNPTRDRILLLSKKQILNLTLKVKQGGFALVPSRIYEKGRWIKVELCLVTGKKLYDKRNDLKEKQAKKQINLYKKV